MLACARIGAVHSVVFGGFAPAELAARIDDAEPVVLVTASCGIEGSRVVEYKPLVDAALRPVTPPAGVHRCAATARVSRGGREHGGARPGLGDGDAACGRAAGRVRPGASHRPAVRPLHQRDHRQAQGDRPRQRRSRGRAALVDGQRVRRAAGRGVVDGQRRGLGRRPLLHRLRAAADRLHDGDVRGQAGRHPRRRRVLAGGGRAPGDRPVHGPDGVPGDQEGGPGRAADGRARPVRRCGRCSWPASGSTRTPTTGRPNASACR